jgi:hypothetical protein
MAYKLCRAFVSLLSIPPLPRAYKAFTEKSINSMVFSLKLRGRDKWDPLVGLTGISIHISV